MPFEEKLVLSEAALPSLPQSCASSGSSSPSDRMVGRDSARADARFCITISGVTREAPLEDERLAGVMKLEAPRADPVDVLKSARIMQEKEQGLWHAVSNVSLVVSNINAQ